MTANRTEPAGAWRCCCEHRLHTAGEDQCRTCRARNPAWIGQRTTNLAPPRQNTGGGRGPAPTAKPANAQGAAKRRPKGPNRTEMRYNSVHLDGQGVFQGLRFAIASDDKKGHCYKPDWIAHRFGRITVVEIKDRRRHHHSHQRSRLAFDAARKEWDWLRARWVWAEWDGTTFAEEIYDTLEG